MQSILKKVVFNYDIISSIFKMLIFRSKVLELLTTFLLPVNIVHYSAIRVGLK